MSTLISTRTALGGDKLPHCQSRSLRLTRYARPDLRDESRKSFLQAAISPKDQRSDDGLKSWSAWLESTLPDPSSPVLYAKLESRLLINMGGTVMENAGLQLDRFGTAYIPGSAVKACARRAAIAALRQWCETGEKPTASDLLAPACSHFTQPEDLLVAILRTFGCTDLEWADTKNSPSNDLAWACGDDLPSEKNQWTTLRDIARIAIVAESRQRTELKPTRRGSVSFLPSYPSARPSIDLELDVLTSHHPEYYGQKTDTLLATDTENPIPVYFPAVSAGTEYAFAILPVGRIHKDCLLHARTWLKVGLEVLGIGAKTAAGYGYFSDITEEISQKKSREAAARLQAQNDAAEKAKKQADSAARKERETKISTLPPAEREDFILNEIAMEWGRLKQYLTNFQKHKPDEQAAILRWFAGAGRERWLTEIKPGAESGKKPWKQIIGPIHAAKKTHNIKLP